jgi:glycine cleavage system transcriptional repressor
LTDTPARPAPNENHLLINAYTTHPQSPLLAVTRRISDSGCNLVDARLSTVGRDVSVTALATGSWDAVAKLETMLGRLEREEGLKLVFYRTGPKQVQSNLLPYIVEVVAADKPGILFQLADFFDRQGITIEACTARVTARCRPAPTCSPRRSRSGFPLTCTSPRCATTSSSSATTSTSTRSWIR